MIESPYVRIADWLDCEAERINRIEREAFKALHENTDRSAYDELMHGKAMVLASLADGVAPFIQDFDEKDAEIIMGRIERFSESACNALEIGSVFYMSALLYPEDHKKGAPNDLENFSAWLREIS